MADKDDGGDKTEKPTQKRLRDARKKGDIPKSKDITSTVELFAWILVLSMGAAFAGERLSDLFEATTASVGRGEGFVHQVSALGWGAASAFLWLTGLAFVPVVVVGVFVELAQTGGVFTFEKLKPSFEKMNPVEGFKRMFSRDNLVEVLKNIAKVILCGLLTWIILKGSLAQILTLISAAPIEMSRTAGAAQAAATLDLSRGLAVKMLSWTLGTFLVVSVIDLVYQRSSFMKKMKMSMRDIRQEHKDNEGDPHVKGHRKQMGQELATGNPVVAAKKANVLVMNPTHIAVAIDYDKTECPVPVIAAKGEGDLAQLMRAAAEEAGVPVVRHVEVARGLYERGLTGDHVPREMFEAVAQVILWAKRLREDAEAGAQEDVIVEAAEDAAGSTA